MNEENSISAKHTEDDGDEAFFRRMYDKAKAAMEKANFCRLCGGDPSFDFQGVGEHTSVFCSDCGESQGVGYGKTPAEAVAAWNALPRAVPVRWLQGLREPRRR